MRTIIEWTDFEIEKPPIPEDGLSDTYRILCQYGDWIYITFMEWDGQEWLFDLKDSPIEKVLGWCKDDKSIKHEIEGPNMKRLKAWIKEEEKKGLKSIHLSLTSLENVTSEIIAGDILNLLEAEEKPITDID